MSALSTLVTPSFTISRLVTTALLVSARYIETDVRLFSVVLCLMQMQVVAKKDLEAELAMRLNVENNVAALVEQTGHSLETLMASIATPVTQDWDCFKSSIAHFNQQCVHLGE